MAEIIPETGNQRRFKRVEVRIAAKLIFKNGPYTTLDAQILNLSEGGAFVHCTTPIKLGEELTLEINLGHPSYIEGKVVNLSTVNHPSAAPVFAQPSEVRWARGSHDSGFGVEFLDLTPEKTVFLRALVEFILTIESKKLG